MKNVPTQPKVLITPEGQSYKPSKDWKPTILITLGTLVLVGLIAGVIYYRDHIEKNLTTLSANLKNPEIFTQFKQASRTESKATSQAKITNLAILDKPTLYSVELEYDPKKNSVISKPPVSFKGDLPTFASDPPKVVTGYFAYQIEVSSESKQVTQSGWITDKPGFKITVKYQPKSLIRVYLPNKKLIWIGKMV